MAKLRSHDVRSPIIAIFSPEKGATRWQRGERREKHPPLAGELSKKQNRQNGP
jgi:hypothetical protein